MTADLQRALAGRYGELVTWLVLSRPQGIYKTALAKLTYLIDLESYRQLGRSMTGADYRRQMRGPLAVDMFACNALDGYELSIERGSRGGNIFRPGPNPRFQPRISGREQMIAEQVLAQYPNLDDVDALIRAAYATKPMVRVTQEEKRKGESLVGVPLEFKNGD